ncbi:MAG: DUF1573 domain-containing protein [Candidatus Omnitrophota bacterium]
MHKLKLMAILMIFSFFNIACYAQDAKKIDEQLNVDDSHIRDFGKVKKSVTLEHDFVFKNESQKMLNIKDITTSCGCTVSTVKNKSLKPQETTEIKVKFDSKGYVGEVKQFIFVNTDSIENPIIQFMIKADVEK